MGVLSFAAVSWLLRNTYQRLERRGVFRVEEDIASRPTAWINGLRGISAIGVVCAHLSTALSPSSSQACCAEGSSWPSAFQLPPLRLLATGHSWLAMFFLLSGLSHSLTPVRLARRGRHEQAFSHLGRSALRRPLRLMLPAAAMTIISWAACQLGGYVAARQAGVWLLSTESPERSAGVTAAVRDLFVALARTWDWAGGPDNRYDHMQYVLPWMLQGSFLLYAVLLLTLGMRPRARLAAIAFLAVLSFSWDFKLVSPQIGFPYLAGAMLAELWDDDGGGSSGSRGVRTAAETVAPLLTPALLAVALGFMSWAKGQNEAIWWARTVKIFLLDALPRVRNSEMLAGDLGAICLTAGCMISARTRAWLVRPVMLWLGRISFAIYLVHFTVIRLAMPWLLYIGNPFAGLLYVFDMQSDGFKALMRGPGVIRTVVGLTLLWLLILAAAHVWMRRVEPVMERIARRLENAVADEGRQALSTRDEHILGENGSLPGYVRSKPV